MNPSLIIKLWRLAGGWYRTLRKGSLPTEMMLKLCLQKELVNFPKIPDIPANTLKLYREEYGYLEKDPIDNFKTDYLDSG